MLAKMSVNEFHSVLMNSPEHGTTSDAVVLNALAAVRWANIDIIRKETLSAEKGNWMGWNGG